MSSTIGLWPCMPARLSQKNLIPLFIILSLLFSLDAFASNGVDNLGREDYDLDNNGLIEINDLADLDEIRNNLDGKTLYGSNVGCPNADDGGVNGGCTGFELTQSLDFDSNANGQMDSGDTYWNESSRGISAGWLPIGDSSAPFSTIFNGNGYTINNLVINRPGSSHVGLFAYTKDAIVENMAIAGPHSSIAGNRYVGALIGKAFGENQIRNILITAQVTGHLSVGGLVGDVYTSIPDSQTQISNSVVSGSVTGHGAVGGVVGFASSSTRASIHLVSGVLSTALVRDDNDRAGGLIGAGNSRGIVTNSYWAQDKSQQESSYGQSERNSYLGLSFEALQCAVAANSDSSTGCVSSDGSAENLTAAMVLYNDWDAKAWDFGTNEQLPGLKSPEQTFRDSDGDGVFDADDAWPNNRAVWKDIDGDGHPDTWSISCDDACIADSGFILDQFPDHAWAYLDADFDGLPDGAEDCVTDCEFDGLTQDSALGDFDNDGVLDNHDRDSDNDGIDDIDADHDGLIEIASLEELNAMHFQLEGAGLQLAATAELDTSGCPFVIFQGIYQQRCSGYELTRSLDFDSNQNGQIDSGDAYWNENSDGISEGWLPVGNRLAPFSATFNGNGYTISNLVIHRPIDWDVGLFGSIENAIIENIALAGPYSSIVGKHNVGALIGSASEGNNIRNILIAARVNGTGSIGGLVGVIRSYNSYSKTQIDNVVVSGVITGQWSVAGLAGTTSSSYNTGIHSINSVLSTALIVVDPHNHGGGLLGQSEYVVSGSREKTSSVVTNSYWAQDVSRQVSSAEQSEANSYVGLHLVTLQCAIAANSDSSAGCVSSDGSAEGLAAAMVLYNDWDTDVWSFGSSEQLPGLIFRGQVIRDSDSDGIIDANDAWPNNRAAWQDVDGDGYPDAWSLECDGACIASSGLILDQFPHHAWAYLDADFDGLPDGAENCITDCELDGLIKDGVLGDIDNDGIPDADDSDSNNDGIDDVDADHNGLVEISSLDQLNAMRFQLEGIGLQLTADVELDRAGCPFVIHQGLYQQRCSGYELTQNLDFDSNANGELDSEDAYWNENLNGISEGWLPIGSSALPFSATFNGNGYTINNLMINRSTINRVGLFGFIRNAIVENIALAGPHSSIVGRSYVGALIGSASEENKIRNTLIAAQVSGYNFIGGLVGSIQLSHKGFKTRIDNSVISGSVIGDRYIGGVVGSAYSSSNGVHILNSVLSTALVEGLIDTGGLVGRGNAGFANNNYWAQDASQQSNSYGESETNSYIGLSLSTLQCAVAANSDSSAGCVSSDGSAEGLNAAMVLYNDWDADIWDFGARDQLPGLKFNGQVLRDSDGDGAVDANDVWPNNRAAWQDTDVDGQPDSWSAACSLPCQDTSGLVLDPLLNDTDNDGATNDVDSDFEHDNGKPVLLTVAATMHVPVNAADGSSFIASAEAVSEQFAALSAIDAVDSLLSFKAYLNSTELVADDDGEITLPSGLQVINWVAVDQSGNESEPLEQNIYVYPQVRFQAANSMIGEGSHAEIIIELSGDSPVYPVTVEAMFNTEASSINQADVDAGFDLGAVYTLTIEVGDDAESFNRQVSLWVPILEDNQSENDELLVVELSAIAGMSEDYDTFFIDEGHKTHGLLVTEQNLAPTVQLLIEQGSIEVSHVKQDGGDVSITAIIDDGNGRDEHSLIWDLDALGLNAPQGRVLQFSPEDLAVGNYTIAVSVMDNGINPLAGNVTVNLLLVAPVIGD